MKSFIEPMFSFIGPILAVIYIQKLAVIIMEKQKIIYVEKLVSALKKNRDFVLKHRNFEKLSEFGHMDNFEQINNRVRNI